LRAETVRGALALARFISRFAGSDANVMINDTSDDLNTTDRPPRKSSAYRFRLVNAAPGVPS
jgi:hypothetical protein